MAYQTFTLTGTFKKPSGDPHEGTVRITPSVPLRDAQDKVIMAGPVSATLVDGAFTITLPAADPTLQPQPHGFTVTPRLRSAGLPSVAFPAPDPGAVINMIDLRFTTLSVPVGDLAATKTDLDLIDARMTDLEAGAGTTATVLASKADASAVSALASTVTEKADASSVSTLTGRVANLETTALAYDTDGVPYIAS